jgi:membrane fusion protein (multidrug efflux system)
MQIPSLKQFMHRQGLWLALGTLLCLLLACEQKKPQQAAAPPPPEVLITKVTQATVPITMDFSGTVKAIRTVDITPRVSGYINERYFTEGTFVKKDDPLYLIDPRPFQARVDAVQAQLKLDRANLNFWEKETARLARLAKKGAASQEATENAIAKRDELRATISKDKANIENAQLNLSFTHITAPFAGRIQQTRINVGNLVKEQRDVLTTLVQMDPVYVIFNISRSQVYDIQLLKRQGKVWPVDQMIVELLLPDGSVYRHQGKVNFISFQINPATDTVTIRAVFANHMDKTVGDYDLIPGQYTPVRLIIGENAKALLIPQPALVESQIGRQVFVVNAQNKVEVRKVEIGPAYQQQWVVTKGLKKGETVIVSGTQKVRPKMTVTPKPYAAAKKVQPKT